MYERLLIAKRHARLVEDLDAIVNDEAENALRDSDGIVVRVTKEVWAAISPYLGASQVVPGWVSGIRRRLPDKTIFLLREGTDLCKDVHLSSHSPRNRFSIYRLTREADARDVLFHEATEEERLAIASQDLLDLVTSNLKAIRISGGKAFHFRLPSGSHSNYFVRLAEAFRNSDLLARAAYWVADALARSHPTLPDQKPTLLVVDNPSMLAVATMAVSMTARPDLEVTCVEQYPQTPLEKVQLAERLAVAVSRVDSALLFVGISSSGRLSASIREFLGKIDSRLPKKLSQVTLFSFGGAEPGALCKLEFPDFFIARSREECSACKQGSSVPVSIHPSVYYVSEPEEVEIPIVPALFQAQRKFILEYGNVDGVLRVHVEDPTDRSPRHHAFYIHVGSLLRSDRAWGELENAITSLAPRPTAILAPDHHTASLLAERAAKVLSIPLFQHKTFRGLEQFPTVLTKLLGGSGEPDVTLLVIDDVIRTGSRVKSINKALREDQAWAELLTRIRHVHFLGAVATTESKRKWGELERGLCRNHPWTAGIQTVFEVPLPNWGAADCPWCHERELLRRLVGPEVFEKNVISERMSRLENTSEGVTSNAFLNIPGQHDPNRAAGSAMFPENLSPMQTLFLFASAVNQSRGLDDGVDDAAFPRPRLVASRVFLDNFNERMKWKALFRSLRPTEMHENARRDVARSITEDINLRQEPHYFGEAFVAALRGVLRDVEPQDLFHIAAALGMETQYVSEVVLGRSRSKG